MYIVGDEELEALKKVIQSKQYFRYQGPNTQSITDLCEQDWRDYFKSPFALLNTSGTNSLVLGLCAFGIGPGDEVIIPSYTFVATASAIMQVGAIPVIANIDESLTIDPKEVRQKITEKTKAIMAVHMDGLICDLSELKSLCEEKNLLLFEDAAQACGGEHQGKPVGTIGSFGAFSFNMDKVITCGEGGLLIIGNEKNKSEFLHALVGHDTACQYGQTLKEKLKDTPRFFGLSTRLNDINSAMLQVQLKRLPEILKTLRANKKELVQFAKDLGLTIYLGHDNDGDIGSMLHLKCNDPMDAIEKTKTLIQAGFKAGPPYLRPAHACWQWFEAMNENHYYVEGLNPYKLTDKKYDYKKADYLTTLKLLGETIRIELNFFERPELKEHLKETLKKIAGQ